MSSIHHTPMVTGQSNAAATFNAPLGQLDAAIGNFPSYTGHSNLADWVNSQTLADGAIVGTVQANTATATVTVDTGEADNFVVASRVWYLVSGVVEYGTVLTASGATIVLTSAPSGTISQNTLIGQLSEALYQATGGYGNLGARILGIGAVAGGDFIASGAGTSGDPYILTTSLWNYRRVYFPEGSYYQLAASVNVASNTLIESVPNAVLDLGGYTFEISGTTGADEDITATASRGANTIAVVAGATFNAGDVVSIVASDEEDNNSESAKDSQRELNEVLSVATNTLTLKFPLAHTYTYDAGYTNQATVTITTPKENVAIRNLAIIDSTTTASLSGGYVVGLTLDNIQIGDSSNAGTLDMRNPTRDVYVRGLFHSDIGNDAGTDNGAGGLAFLTDTTRAWRTNQWVGFTLTNVDDVSTTTVTANTPTTATGVLSGGTGVWDNGDAYILHSPQNSAFRMAGVRSGYLYITTIGAKDGVRLSGCADVMGTIRAYESGERGVRLYHCEDVHLTDVVIKGSQTSASNIEMFLFDYCGPCSVDGLTVDDPNKGILSSTVEFRYNPGVCTVRNSCLNLIGEAAFTVKGRIGGAIIESNEIVVFRSGTYVIDFQPEGFVPPADAKLIARNNQVRHDPDSTIDVLTFVRAASGSDFLTTEFDYIEVSNNVFERGVSAGSGSGHLVNLPFSGGPGVHTVRIENNAVLGGDTGQGGFVSFACDVDTLIVRDNWMENSGSTTLAYSTVSTALYISSNRIGALASGGNTWPADWTLIADLSNNHFTGTEPWEAFDYATSSPTYSSTGLSGTSGGGQFLRNGKFVTIRGGSKKTTGNIAAADIITTLPAGCRPAKAMHIVATTDTWATAILEIATTGVVTVKAVSAASTVVFYSTLEFALQ